MELRLRDRLWASALDGLAVNLRDVEGQRLLEAYSPVSGLDEARLREVRNLIDAYNRLIRANFDLRHYQVVALLLTADLIRKHDSGEEQARTWAYWMATGSGKTLLMHLNVMQLLQRWQIDRPDRVELIVTTPGLNLIEQHRRELEPLVSALGRWSGVRIDLMLESTQALLGYPKDYFDLLPGSKTRRIVVVDEAHIGLTSSEEGAFRRLRGRMTGDKSVLLEYSATFRNLNRAIQATYEEAIVFAYEYADFFHDGYGKDYHFRRIRFDVADDEAANLHETFRVYCEKLEADRRLPSYGRDDDVPLRPRSSSAFPDRPLLAFMGSTVTRREEEAELSDVGKIVRFLANLSPAERRRYSQSFHGSITGRLRVSRNRQAPDELLLSYGDGPYWGLVNVGNGDAFFDRLLITNVDRRDAEVVPWRYRFAALDDPHSGINVLVGSRKFAEGWNSYRVSVLGLINLGTARGNKIIQIFGRGVRLRGAARDGKREHEPHFVGYDDLGQDSDADLRRLETLVVVSLRRTYLETFVAEIEAETGVEIPYAVPVTTRRLKAPDGSMERFGTYSRRLPVVRLAGEAPDWVSVSLAGTALTYGYIAGIGRRSTAETHELRGFTLSADYRVDRDQPGHDVRQELATAAERPAFDRVGLDQRLRDRALHGRIQLYGSAKAGLRPVVFTDILPFCTQVWYHEGLGDDRDEAASLTRAEAISSALVDDFVRRLRRRVIHDIGSRHYVLDQPLRAPTATGDSDFPSEYVLSRVFESQEHFQAFEASRGSGWAEDDLERLALPGLGPHLFAPVLAGPSAIPRPTRKELDDLRPLRVRPDALNAGERKFVADLDDWLQQGDTSSSYAFYLFRNSQNVSHRIGIYLESDEHVYLPDFLLWAIEKRDSGTTHLCFVDPKGQTGMIDPSTLDFNAKVRLGEAASPALRDLARRLSGVHQSRVQVHSFMLLRDSSQLGREQSHRGDLDWLRRNLVNRNLLRLDWHRHREDGSPSDFFALFNGLSYLDIMLQRLSSATK